MGEKQCTHCSDSVDTENDVYCETCKELLADFWKHLCDKSFTIDTNGMELLGSRYKDVVELADVHKILSRVYKLTKY